jgi:hypothetical protein
MVVFVETTIRLGHIRDQRSEMFNVQVSHEEALVERVDPVN